MFFKPGDKVTLKYTGETGEVVSFADMGIVQVKLSVDFTIPVNVEDLAEFKEKTAFAQPVPTPSQQNLENPNITFPSSKVNNTGIFTGFLPQLNKFGEIIDYLVYFINDTRVELIFEFSIPSNFGTISSDGFLPTGSAKLIGKIQKEVIEQQSECVIKISDFYTSGIENTRTQTIKLKPKTFFSKEDILPFFDKLGYLFQFKADPLKSEPVESLADFTKTALLNKPKKEVKAKEYVSHVDPIKRAVFTNELDLHIEALIEPGTKLDPPQILQLQMAVFDRYIADAVRHGIDKVYIVHGLGTGRLKNAIAKRLSINPYVLEFKNEYLPSYGFGATEVKLR